MSEQQPPAPTVTQMVYVPDIVLAERFQIRRKLDAGTVARYAKALKAGAVFPPIIVAKVGGATVLVDGWHRLKAGAADDDYIDAVVITATEREILWLSAQANDKHGLPLKASERVDAFNAYIRARKHIVPGKGLRSYRDIALDLGGTNSYSTIRRWMMKYHRRIAHQYKAEQYGVRGGLRDRPQRGDGFTSAALSGLEAARTSYTGIADPQNRGEVIEAATAMLREMRESAEWETPDY
jgi:hypothetical protein